MSSPDFQPIWSTQKPSGLTAVAFPRLANAESRVRSYWKAHQLQELGGSPTRAMSPKEPVSQVGPDLIQAAFERGFAEGREQGVAEGYEKLLPALEALGGLTQALSQTHADFRQDLERGLHALAIAVARTLIQREVAADPTIVSDLIERALDLVPHNVTLEVRLNPEDLEVLQGRLDQLEVAGRPLHVQWLGDTTLERGSFLLETPLRVVDGRTDEALRALYERLGHD